MSKPMASPSDVATLDAICIPSTKLFQDPPASRGSGTGSDPFSCRKDVLCR